MKITFVSSLIFALFLGLTNQQCLTPNDLRPSRSGQQVLYTGEQEFSLALLQAINKLNPQENIFFSPYSTYHAMLLAYFISAGQTEKFLKKSLRLDPALDKSDIFSAYKLDKFATSVRAVNSTYELSNANRIYIAEQIKLRDCVTAIFGDELLKRDFRSNPETARVEINQWVENRTHDMIKDLLTPGTIDQQTNLVLVNAAYFKGKWEKQFNAENTKPEIFYISPVKQTLVDMMHINAEFNYGVSETLVAHILELPYEGEDISMYILLPPFSTKDGIETVLKKLTIENFRNVVNGSLSSQKVQVSLPKFSLERTIELVPILESIGVGNLFQQDADFSVLTGVPNLKVGEGVHKAKIEVTEEGTRAAGATAFFTLRMIADDIENMVEFKCNRPFLFVLYNKRMHTILFTGIFRNPLS